MDDPFAALDQGSRYYLRFEHGTWQAYELGVYQRIDSLASAIPIHLTERESWS